jgi:hypothetical protein
VTSVRVFESAVIALTNRYVVSEAVLADPAVMLGRKFLRKVVSQTFARWNRIGEWLSRLEALRRVA